MKLTTNLASLAFTALLTVTATGGCALDDNTTDDDVVAEEGLGDDVDLGQTEQDVTNGATNYVCADSLTLRSSPGGQVVGTMYSGLYRGFSYMYVQTTSGSWSYGYSYSLGKWGWAMSYYLTTNAGYKGTPGQRGYQMWCQRGDGSWWGGGIG